MRQSGMQILYHLTSSIALFPNMPKEKNDTAKQLLANVGLLCDFRCFLRFIISWNFDTIEIQRINQMNCGVFHKTSINFVSFESLKAYW